MKLTVRIKIAAVGRLKQDFLKEGVEEYLQRLSHYVRVEMKEVKSPARSGKQPAVEIRRREGEALLAAIGEEEYVIALDPAGTLKTSEEWAEFFRKTPALGKRTVTFVIGGELGLGRNVLNRSDETWSLSPLTFPHDMSRLILLEQLYRAMTILSGQQYHK